MKQERMRQPDRGSGGGRAKTATRRAGGDGGPFTGGGQEEAHGRGMHGEGDLRRWVACGG